MIRLTEGNRNSSCVIFGGAGYIGSNLARRLEQTRRFETIVLVDINPPQTPLVGHTRFVHHDVREPIDGAKLGIESPVEWIFHLAAVHREPGHLPPEYFQTNLPSARHVADFADAVECRNICFTSSIAVYGPTSQATDETASLEPTTPYGISKLCSELALEAWLASNPDKRLVVVRPGVVYGPGDPGNIGRLMKAIRSRRFAFPGSKSIRKSYAYIEGLLDSILFMMERSERHLIYNYVEKETLPLGEAVREIAEFLGAPVPKLSLPIGTLASAAHLVQITTAGRSPIHPARVRKAATQTWIVPKRLSEMGFEFHYDLRSSLEHWKEAAPREFE